MINLRPSISEISQKSVLS